MEKEDSAKRVTAVVVATRGTVATAIKHHGKLNDLGNIISRKKPFFFHVVNLSCLVQRRHNTVATCYDKR
jgi:hypothetical protein